MNPQRGKRWEAFLEHAAQARAKPAFDAEERDWRLRIADRFGETLQAARDGDDFLSLLNAAYHQGGLFSLVSSRAHREWFNAWAAADPESARRALAAFGDPSSEAEERFSSFARILEEAAANEGVVIEPTAALTLGSVCNFAADPLALPIMRPGVFGSLEQLLGHDRPPDTASIADAYAGHLAFARWLRSQMEQSGFALRDMVDVQSLIFIAVQARDFWAGDRLYAIGVPPPVARPERDSSAAARPYLGICAIYRDEAPYLAEWIEFHRLVGVERFFLYDNRSEDNHREVLAPYVERDIAIVHDWPMPRGQIPAYDDCVKRHGDESRWIAFIDCDEFLFSPTGRSLPEVMADYEGWPGVGVNWAIFGTSGHVTKPPGLVIENYLMRAKTVESRFIKSIVEPSRVARCRNHHQFLYRSLLAVDENHYPIHGTHTKSTSIRKLRVNHYVTKSAEEARARRPGDWDPVNRWRATNLIDDFPQQPDETVTSYVPDLRRALAAG